MARLIWMISWITCSIEAVIALDQMSYRLHHWETSTTQLDMRSGGTTSNTDHISGMLSGVDTRHTGSDTSQWYPSGIPPTYLASRSLLGRDGQDSEGSQENRQRPVPRGANVNPTLGGSSDHEDSRRLASGLPTHLSGEDSGGNPGSQPRTDRSVLGRQTDPGDRRTSDWRSSTLGSHPTAGS